MGSSNNAGVGSQLTIAMKWPKNAISMQAFRAPMYLQTMRNYQDAHLVDPDALGKDSTINISGK